MNYPVITSDQVHALNTLAQKVDPRLFWCCNYEPTFPYAISEDARFAHSVQDLYKFTVDTGGIISEFSNICENKAFPNHISNDVRMLVDTVKMLRHYTDHNNHLANGYIEKHRIAECQKWILKHAGTGIPGTQEDFAKLNHELDRIAQQLLKYSKEMIQFAIDHPDSNTVNRWQVYILSWYSNPSHFDVYQGYLIDVYLSKASTKRPQVKNLPLCKLQQKTNRWISSRVDQLEQNIRDQKTKIATVKMNLKRLPQEQRKQAVSIISEFESQLELMEKEYEPYYRKDSDVNIFKRELKTQLQTTIQLLEEKGETFSLLPQDLIPKDIARIFKDVPSLDNDFM